MPRKHSSTTHEIIWETNSKKGANVFCALTETLVQRTNDANKVGQAFFWSSCLQTTQILLENTKLTEIGLPT